MTQWCLLGLQQGSAPTGVSDGGGHLAVVGTDGGQAEAGRDSLTCTM